MWNIHFKCLSPIALEIIAEQGNPESLWLLLGTYMFLKKILIEVCDFYHLKKNKESRTRDKKLTRIFHFLFTAPFVFVVFKNVSALLK